MELIDGATAELLCVRYLRDMRQLTQWLLEHHHHQRQENEHRVEQRRVRNTPINNEEACQQNSQRGQRHVRDALHRVHSTDHVLRGGRVNVRNDARIEGGEHNTRQHNQQAHRPQHRMNHR